MSAPKLLVALFIALFAVSAAQAVDLSSWKVELQLNEDKTVDWKITLEYEDFVSRDDYWILARIADFSVIADGQPAVCRKAPSEVGTQIICDELFAKIIIFSIKSESMVGGFDNFNLFSYTFPVTRVTDKFTLRITIPLGSALASIEQLRGTGLAPFAPSFGKEGTDGRKIFVTWDLQNPKLGETINALMIFEPVVGPIAEIAVVILIGAVIGFVLLLNYRRGRVKHVLPILTASERTVMQIVMKSKSVDQRDIVKETDFSKAKVSRILKELEERGLVETQPKGRTKLVKVSDGSRKEEKKSEAKTEEDTEKRKKEERQKNIIKKLLGKE